MVDHVNSVVVEDVLPKYRRSLRKKSSKKRKRENDCGDDDDDDDEYKCPSVFGLHYDDDQDVRTGRSLLTYTSRSAAMILRKLNRPFPTVATILRYLLSVIVAYTETEHRVTLRVIVRRRAVFYPDIKSYLELRTFGTQQRLPMHWIRNVEELYNHIFPSENCIQVTSARTMPWMERKKSYITLGEFISSQFESDPDSPDGIGECCLSDDDIHFCREFTRSCNREKHM